MFTSGKNKLLDSPIYSLSIGLYQRQDSRRDQTEPSQLKIIEYTNTNQLDGYPNTNIKPEFGRLKISL